MLHQELLFMQLTLVGLRAVSLEEQNSAGISRQAFPSGVRGSSLVEANPDEQQGNHLALAISSLLALTNAEGTYGGFR